MIFEALVKPISDILGQVLPDTKAKDKAMAEIEAKIQEALTKENLGQIEINKIEASSSNFFIAGARPALMWICVVGVGYAYIGYPLLVWIAPIINYTGTLPALETNSLLQLVLGMLGLGSLRTYEKIKGVNGVH